MAVDHETRLSLAEERISRHEKMHEETQESVKEIANGVARLVEAAGTFCRGCQRQRVLGDV